MYIRTKTKRCLIKQFFSSELYFELMKITMMGKLNNNQKGSVIKQTLTKYNVPWTSLGPGTNRVAFLIDGYCVKVGLDKDGMVDNRREMLYSKPLQPYVLKVYECTPNGLLAVSEYVSKFSIDDFYRYQRKMREILSTINEAGYLIGDVGITTKNYTNWGIKNDGSICILDFAYIYEVNYGIFKCRCNDTALLEYDNDFVKLMCPRCGKRYEFDDLRGRITRAEQEKEIGDIRRLSYNITKPLETVTPVEKFEPPKDDIKRKEKTEDEILLEMHRKEEELLNSGVDYWEMGDMYDKY